MGGGVWVFVYVDFYYLYFVGQVVGEVFENWFYYVVGVVLWCLEVYQYWYVCLKVLFEGCVGVVVQLGQCGVVVGVVWYLFGGYSIDVVFGLVVGIGQDVIYGVFWGKGKCCGLQFNVVIVVVVGCRGRC